MFPKSIATSRAVPGSFASATLSRLSEGSTGSAVVNTSITYTNPDPSDVLEFEYFNGSTWITVSGEAGVESIPYAIGRDYRIRLTNSFFGSASAYQNTPGLSTDEVTGGSVALDAVMPGVGQATNRTISSNLSGNRTVTFRIGLDQTFFLNSRSFFNKYFLTTVKWMELNSPGGSEVGIQTNNQTCSIWAPASGGSPISNNGITLTWISNNTYEVSLVVPIVQFFAYFTEITFTIGMDYIDAAGPSRTATWTV